MSIDLTGYAFPTAVVKYHGATDTRGSRYTATMKRYGQTYRASVPYNYASPSEAPVAAAWAVMEKVATDSVLAAADFVTVEGDLGDATSVTFLPKWAAAKIGEQA